MPDTNILNVVVDRDAADNIKPTKATSPEKIDGIVASIWRWIGVSGTRMREVFMTAED